ncbi:MAG: EamA family transporter [Acidobacteriales bacterium]|nr:EamA family transporter [Terriglobales bacterium]
MPTPSMRPAHPVRGYLWIAAAATLWGTSATLGKAAFQGLLAANAEQTRIDVLILAQSRTTMALLVLAPILFALRGGEAFRLPRRSAAMAIFMGVAGIAGANYFYYYAIAKTSVATAIVIQYTAPIYVLGYMALRGRQRASFERVGSVALAILGVALVIGAVHLHPTFPFATLSGLQANGPGVMASILASFSFAIYSLTAAGLVNRHSLWTVFLYALAGAAVFWLVINPPWKILAAHYSPVQWGFLFVFSMWSMLAPFACYLVGMRSLDPTRAIVTASLEPVVAILGAAVVLSEPTGLMQVIGMVIVLAATIVIQIPEKDETA